MVHQHCFKSGINMQLLMALYVKCLLSLHFSTLSLYICSFINNYICLANFTLVSSAILFNRLSAFFRALKGSELVKPWKRLQSGTGLKHILLNSLALDNAVQVIPRANLNTRKDHKLYFALKVAFSINLLFISKINNDMIQSHAL